MFLIIKNPEFKKSTLGILLLLVVVSGCVGTSTPEYYQLGTQNIENEEWGQALKNLSSSINRNPNYPPAYNARAHVLIKKYQFGRALSDVNQAIQLIENKHSNFSLINPYRQKGFILTLMKEYESSIEAYKKAFKLVKRQDPKRGPPPNMIMPFYMINDHSGVLKYNHPENPIPELTVYYERGNKKKFEQFLNKLQKGQFTSDYIKTSLLMDSAIYHVERGSLDKARKLVVRALSNSVKRVHVAMDLAFHKFRSLTLRNPYPPEIYFILSEEFEEQGRKKLAFEYAWYASELDPENKRYNRLRNVLQIKDDVTKSDFEHWPKLVADLK